MEIAFCWSRFPKMVHIFLAYLAVHVTTHISTKWIFRAQNASYQRGTRLCWIKKKWQAPLSFETEIARAFMGNTVLGWQFRMRVQIKAIAAVEAAQTKQMNECREARWIDFRNKTALHYNILLIDFAMQTATMSIMTIIKKHTHTQSKKRIAAKPACVHIIWLGGFMDC